MGTFDKMLADDLAEAMADFPTLATVKSPDGNTAEKVPIFISDIDYTASADRGYRRTEAATTATIRKQDLSFRPTAGTIITTDDGTWNVTNCTGDSGDAAYSLTLESRSRHNA